MSSSFTRRHALYIAVVFACLDSLHAQVDFTSCGALLLEPEGAGWDGSGIWAPEVVDVGGTRSIWYAGRPGMGIPGDPIALGLAESAAEDECLALRVAGPVLSNLARQAPAVLVEEVDGSPRFTLFYTEVRSTQGEIGEGLIGRAVVDADGVVLEDDGIVMRPSEPWERSFVAAPSIIEDGDRLRMWYSGGFLGNWSDWKIGYAESEDGGRTWKKLARNPIYAAGEVDGPGGVQSSHVIFEPESGTLEMWYAHRGDGGRNLGFARSMDGFAWAAHGRVNVAGAPNSVFQHPAVIYDPDEKFYELWYSVENFGGIAQADGPWTLPRASFEATTEASEPLLSTFDASRTTTPASRIEEYRWDFGDGSEELVTTEETVVHDYVRPGEFEVTLTVRDDAGNEGRVAGLVRVELPSEDFGRWTSATLGEVSFPGATVPEGDDCATLHAAAGAIGGRDDHAHFLHTELAPDGFSMRVELEDDVQLGSTTRLAVLVRASLESGAASAGCLLRPSALSGWTVDLAIREQAGASMASRRADPDEVPAALRFMRIDRTESSLAVLASADGEAWSKLTWPESLRDELDAFFDETSGLPLLAGVAIADPLTADLANLSSASVCVAIEELDDPAPSFLRGDCNADGAVTGSPSDAIFLLDWLFTGGPEPGCLAACNPNGDGVNDLSDAVYLLAFNFNGGPAPMVPFPECGPLAADEALSCETAPVACEAP